MKAGIQDVMDNGQEIAGMMEISCSNDNLCLSHSECFRIVTQFVHSTALARRFKDERALVRFFWDNCGVRYIYSTVFSDTSLF